MKKLLYLDNYAPKPGFEYKNGLTAEAHRRLMMHRGMAFYEQFFSQQIEWVVAQAEDCDFSGNGHVTSSITHNGVTYKTAFVGCTYHCG